MPILELETMRCDLDGPLPHLARLRFNRTEALNAANWAWVEDLVSATNYLAQSAETRVVIVSGEGRSFCSGLDTKELAMGNLTVDWFETWERGVTALANLKAISIAAIHGHCLGGGLQVALACDLRIAATNAVLSIPAVKEGLVAALGPMRLTRLIGAGPAKQLCLLGHRFTTEEGYVLRIINEVVDPDPISWRKERWPSLMNCLISHLPPSSTQKSRLMPHLIWIPQRIWPRSSRLRRTACVHLNTLWSWKNTASGKRNGVVKEKTVGSR